MAQQEFDDEDSWERASAPWERHLNLIPAGRSKVTSHGAAPSARKEKPVYLSTVKDQYGSPEYEAVSAAVGNRFPSPEWRIIEPAKLGWASEDWRRDWPKLAAIVETMALWPRPDFTIGAGCYEEARNIQARGKTVIGITPSGEFFDIDQIYSLPCIPGINRSHRRAVVIPAGVDASEANRILLAALFPYDADEVMSKTGARKYRAGYNARKAGKPIEACPRGGRLSWERGWRDANCGELPRA